MITAVDMINKILWDDNIKSEDIKIGYYDRVLKNIQYIQFNRLWISPGDKFSFRISVDNKVVNIPYHRLRVVLKKDKIIWKRRCEDVNQKSI